MILDAGAQEVDVAGPQDRPDAKSKHAALGPTVARLSAMVEDADVLFVAASERRGEAVVRALHGATPATVLWCPPSDALPGEKAPASPAIAGQRVAALGGLRPGSGARLLLVTDATSAAQLVAPPENFASTAHIVRVGDEVDGAALAVALEATGYVVDDRIDEPGEIAVRGGVIDVFPADADLPVRIHFAEGRVERIGDYDPVTQLGTPAERDEVMLSPVAEPVARSGAVTIFDHLPTALIAMDPEVPERRDRFLELAREARAGEAGLVDASRWRNALGTRDVVMLAEGEEQAIERFVESRRPVQAVLRAIREAQARKDRVVVAGSPRDLRFIARRLEQQTGDTLAVVTHWREIASTEPGALVGIAVELDRGWREPGLFVLATADMLGARAVTTTTTPGANALSQSSGELQLGDAVIHEDHGLGVLTGLETITTLEQTGVAIRLSYAGDTQRLVPVEEANRLWRYGADADSVTLDKLDGSSWAKRRGDIEATIAETARHLVELSAERARRTAAVLSPPVADYERFSAGFAFTETPDQLRAILDVQADLASGKPMDRLVVGDVGYGKTEVALRAAAVAALAGKQVAVVAPTTVLVRQHIETFRRRFAASGVQVAGLSRLSSPAEARAVKQGLADGSIRVVVGTKAVAGKGVAFADLALVVIDEEQRFGSADKVKLRTLAADAHVLTMTATPIPRTLQTALVGLQDLSLIATPPARRMPTRTSVASFTPELVRAALLREQKRGGQSFAVVPRIDDMANVAEKLRSTVPGLSVIEVHGKLPAAELDEAMVRFANGDGDILLATNIIEAGLDIPRANTMIIWRADRFGLSQLHQLRGRVGRGRVRGQLLLLTEADAAIAPATLKRLRTLEALDKLGAGFAISARDLDMRGAGDMLGDEQAGHVKLIGVDLYQHLLEQALRVARGEAVDDWLPELRLGVSGSLPEEWIPEEDLRASLYVRVARLASSAELDALTAEFEDRFGTLPPEAQMLIELAELRQLARATRIARVDAGPAAIALTPRADFAGTVPGAEDKGGRLVLKEATEADAGRLARVKAVLSELEGD